MQESTTGDECDYCSIVFPSDQISIGAMRRSQPEVVKKLIHGDTIVQAALLEKVTAMLSVEMQLAANAFAVARGHRVPYHRYSHDQDLAALDGYYQEWGLSSGPQCTKEMVRRIEESARAQAHTRRLD